MDSCVKCGKGIYNDEFCISFDGEGGGWWGHATCGTYRSLKDAAERLLSKDPHLDVNALDQPNALMDMLPRETILQEAETITSGDRQDFYGHPTGNHGCIAEVWSGYLRRKGILKEGSALDGRDVSMLMILKKVIRDANKRQRDNLVDIAGYARNAEQMLEGRDD